MSSWEHGRQGQPGRDGHRDCNLIEIDRGYTCSTPAAWRCEERGRSDEGGRGREGTEWREKREDRRERWKWGRKGRWRMRQTKRAVVRKNREVSRICRVFLAFFYHKVKKKGGHGGKKFKISSITEHVHLRGCFHNFLKLFHRMWRVQILVFSRNWSSNKTVRIRECSKKKKKKDHHLKFLKEWTE